MLGTADLLLDDAPHNLVGGHYLKVLMTRPHNKDAELCQDVFSREYIHRVGNLDEAYATITKLLFVPEIV